MLSSAQIAALNGSFAQQHMSNMQYAGMISNNTGVGFNPAVQHEGLAAGALNTASAVGGPLAMGGLALAGLDPLSMGVRSGMGAMSAGAGLGGGLLAGGLAAGGMGIGLAGVGYMGNQMMAGAQETQQFNAGMRRNFTFMNQGSSSGRGFGQEDNREIGNFLRDMAGSGGMVDMGVSFNELGRMAANMGRMGMGDNVRNAREFKDKFTEMLKSVKEIAKEMNTSMEQAQEMMASMRGSGIFKGQAAVSGRIRQASVAGGLATTEVTGMMGIGSQISRMYGGTGRQGALGGMEAISQIGSAQQIGALSDEDIYQATGQTGAEGRRSLAQQQLMQTGQFLKGSKGRWLLASLAGRDGQLDPSSVADFMSGGMGVGDVRAAAHKNLAGIGRANFIRNEGRLRGSVMEQFGGLAPAMMMQQLAQSRGIDVSSMGDREMLFFQRQMGLGRDEADAVAKMTRRLPDILRQRREAGEDDMFIQERSERAEDSGIAGIKSKLEKARDTVNNELKSVGQDILNVASERIARWGNKLTRTYEERSIAGIREAHRAAMMGGSRGEEISETLLGGGAFTRDLGGSARSSNFKREDVGQARYREIVQDLQFSSRMGGMGSLSAKDRSLVGGNDMDLRRAYADELSGLKGEDRIAGFRRRFGKDTDIGKRMQGMSEREQARFIQQVEGELGMKRGRLSETFEVPGLPELRGGQFATEAEFHESRGREMLGIGRSTGAQAADTTSRGLAAITSAPFAATLGLGTALAGGVQGAQESGSFKGALGGAKGALSGMLGTLEGFTSMPGDFIEELTGRSKTARAASQALDDPRMRRIAFDTLRGAKGSEARLLSEISEIRGAAAEAGGMDKVGAEDLGRLQFLEQTRLTSELMQVANAKGGVEQMSDADWSGLIKKQKRIVRELGGDPDIVTKDYVLRQAQGVQGKALEQRKEIINKVAGQIRKSARQEARTFEMGGIARLSDKGSIQQLELTKEARDKLRKEGGAGAIFAAELAMDVQNVALQMPGARTEEDKAALVRMQEQFGGQLFEQMAGMDVKSLRAVARQFAGTQVGGQASEMIMRGTAIEGSKRKLGAGGAIASQLGVDLSREEMAGLKGMTAQQAAAAIASRMGVTDDKGFVSGLQEAIAAAGEQGGGVKGGALLQRALAQASDKTKEKLEERARGQESPEEKILDKLGEGNRFLEALVKANDKATRHLQAITNNTSKTKDDAEAGA